MAKDDDRPIRSNASPEPRPPGVARDGMAPPGAVGTGRPWVEGPFYLGGHGANPFRGGVDQDGQTAGPVAPDKSIPRFDQTGDPDVDRFYAQDHAMVDEQGQEHYPGNYPREETDTPESLGAEQDTELDRFYEGLDAGVPTEGLSDDPDLDRFYDPERTDFGAGDESPDGLEPERDKRPPPDR